MTAIKHFFLLYWVVAFCNGYNCRHHSGEKPNGEKPITEPFAFQTWDDFATKSKISSKVLKKNPVSYSNKFATPVEMTLEPLKVSKIDHDENVRSVKRS